MFLILNLLFRLTIVSFGSCFGAWILLKMNQVEHSLTFKSLYYIKVALNKVLFVHLRSVRCNLQRVCFLVGAFG